MSVGSLKSANWFSIRTIIIPCSGMALAIRSAQKSRKRYPCFTVRQWALTGPNAQWIPFAKSSGRDPSTPGALVSRDRVPILAIAWGTSTPQKEEKGKQKKRGGGETYHSANDQHLTFLIVVRPLCDDIPLLPCTPITGLGLHRDQILTEVARCGVDGETLPIGSLDASRGESACCSVVAGIGFLGGGRVEDSAC